MKKVFKRALLLLCLTLFFMTGFHGVNNVYADEEEIEDGDLSLEEGAEVYYMTDEEKVLLATKIHKANLHLLSSETSDSENTRSLIEFSLSVPRYQQENGYYCGPATVKEILQYYNGSSLTQSQYASALGTTTLGTDMPIITSVLNNNLSSNISPYSYDDTWTSFSEWSTRVKYAIDTGHPVVVDINSSAGYASLPYASSTGHYLAIIGYCYNPPFSSLSLVKVADPSSACNSYYSNQGSLWYSASDLFSANAAHFRHAIIW